VRQRRSPSGGLLLALLCALTAAATLHPSAAAAVTFAERDRVLSVSPAVTAVTANAGTTAEIRLTLANRTGLPFGIRTGALDVAPGATAAQDKQLVPAGESKRGAAEWVSFEPAELRLEPDQETVLRVLVRVPAGTAPGGWFAALQTEARPLSGAGNLTVTTSLTSLALITVQGKIEHDLHVALRPARRLRFGTPLAWDLELRNTGNVHEVFNGKLEVDGLLAPSRSRGVQGAIVLPGAVRRFRLPVELRSVPDVVSARVRWTADQSVEAQPSGSAGANRITPARQVVLLPLWFLTVLGAVTTLVLIRVFIRRRNRPRYVDEADDQME